MVLSDHECRLRLNMKQTDKFGCQKNRTYILSTKRNAMFLFAIFGLKIIDFKNCFNSVVLPSNKDIDCIVSS